MEGTFVLNSCLDRSENNSYFSAINKFRIVELCILIFFTIPSLYKKLLIITTIGTLLLNICETRLENDSYFSAINEATIMKFYVLRIFYFSYFTNKIASCYKGRLSGTDILSLRS